MSKVYDPAAAPAVEANPPGPSPEAGAGRLEGLPEPTDMDLLPPTGGPFLNQGTLLILLVAAIAAAAIYAMRLTQNDIGAGSINKSAEARVADALAKLSQPKAMDPADPLLPQNLNRLLDMDAVISWFASDHTDRQVPLEYLRKNPFRIVTAPVAPEVSKTTGPVADRQDDERLRQLKMEVGGLRLQSVVNGARPIAVINGVIVQQGQKYGSFTVRTISGVGVDLESAGKTFTLRMDVNPNGLGPNSGSPPGFR